MSDSEYMEKYGDDGYWLDGIELEREQQRIANEERLENYKKCIEEIKGLVNKQLESFREYEDVFEEIKECVEELYEYYS